MANPNSVTTHLQKGCQRRSDETHHLRIETVHEYEDSAHHSNTELVAAERTLIDKFTNVDEGTAASFMGGTPGEYTRLFSVGPTPRSG
jgi:hypothetical protein